ncbi:polyribonucleotide nucleotidyltransferase 2, mitochondrial isoform X1 [Dendrobium catenatum]|uniref:Polyribonucleotide nucleotidyltransferase 2, mitochondrial n=2 Tax=Dendrobium catenatum TaxID=906689 RepID=A0A2I0VWQ6_9ASPA|nr:polyribonucleotide nucleotidyltransferase 2, mitochondrial isoform X1 [Dendrobium catenatum]PKU67843.1 Polyribonucleotide nucleotidyltransferase 2, mitochondrial [Dendrobium catenatum]
MAAAISIRAAKNPLISALPRYLTWRSPGFRRFCSSSLDLQSASLSEPELDMESHVYTYPLIPGRKVLGSFKEEFEIGSRIITIETGKIARFANGSVVITMDETNVLSTISSAKTDGSRDFLPLTVDYQEKQYAQGVIPTTFMRREGAPKERELLCGRLIDRPIRPLFPAGFYHEVQATVNVLSSDGKQDPDVLAANATSAALMLSDIPWGGPVGMIRVGRIDGQFVFNPTMDELSMSDLNLVYACTRDKTLMIDVQAREISEKDLEAALKIAHPEAVKYIEPQIKLAEKAGKQKKEYKLSMITDRTLGKIRSLAEGPIEAVFTDAAYGKFERGEALDKITQDVRAKLEEEFDEESLKVLPKAVDTVRKQIVRKRVIDKGLRVDGRKLDEVRPLHCEAGTYPILHGSSIFSRGDTQVLCTVTIGAPGDAQRLDSLVGPPTKRFMLHYTFPPFCINEVGKRGGLNRREVGHGTLAEKALLAVLPPEDEFQYAVRVNSEVMSSDGSTSMASVCGGSMALMDAGIPVREHVAGLSVGLVSEVDPSTGNIKDYRILTDILGLEDHLGDMDFKIAGTRKGITAIQLDIKPAGIPLDIICECLETARKGRIQIIDRMDEELSSPRTLNDGNAPRLATMRLDEESLRRLLGPLGLHRKKIEQETGARIAVSDGVVTIVAKNQLIMEKAQQKVDFLVGRQVQVGSIYKGVISSIKEYGAFVEFNGGQQGLLHISELSHEPLSKVSDAVSIGQELSVMCIGQDVRGNIKLSLKATLTKRGSEKKCPEDSIPVSSDRQAVNFWSTLADLPLGKEDAEPLVLRTDGEGESVGENVESSAPSVVVRSAAECDARDNVNYQNVTKKAKAKSLPRPYNSVPSQKDKVASSRSTIDLSSGKRIASLLNISHVTKEEDALPMDVSKSRSSRVTSVNANSLKLGDRFTAKIYQIRARGLVLEVAGGVRGMYKFEVDGRKDFEAGEELQVKCTSFSAKGIPVFSLLEGK